MSKLTKIYPIELNHHFAEKLVRKHAQSELNDATNYWHGPMYEYNYSATLYANGSVKLFVGYSFDSGFCQASGPCLEKTIRPFNKDEIKKIEESQKRHIAEIEYERRQTVIREIAIAEIIDELFE